MGGLCRLKELKDKEIGTLYIRGKDAIRRVFKQID